MANSIHEMFSQAVTELLGRVSGPLHFRFLLMPTVVTFLAIRAARRDVREGNPPFLWGIVTNRAERPRLLRSAISDIGRVCIVAVILDTVYQVIVLKTLHVIQLLIMAVVCAVIPYTLVRGPVTRLLRRFRRTNLKANPPHPR